MKCPRCSNADLLITDRQGIEIDFCSQCRGVWLDRGELDKIIERTSDAFEPRRGGRDDDDDDDDRRRYPPQGPGGHPPQRRKSMWRELFDFD